MAQAPAQAPAAAVGPVVADVAKRRGPAITYRFVTFYANAAARDAVYTQHYMSIHGLHFGNRTDTKQMVKCRCVSFTLIITI